VCIYADNDAGSSYAGQAAAYALARRLKRDGGRDAPRRVEVFVPRQAGEDWADVWFRRSRRLPKAA
jgi:putative DNA primase/helicase